MVVNQAAIQEMYNSFYALFQEQYEASVVFWDKVAMNVPSQSEKNTYAWLGSYPAIREWIGERVIANLEAFSYEIVNKDFEATLSVHRNHIEDDKMGIYNPMVRTLAETAKQHADKLVFELLKNGWDSKCYDGQNFFDADHPVGINENQQSVSNTQGGTGKGWFLIDATKVMKPLILQTRKQPEFVSLDKPDDERAFMRKELLYGVDDRKNAGYGLWQLAYGSKQDLTETNYESARAAMSAFTDNSGNTLGISPSLLICPPSLEGDARRVLKAENTDAGKSNIWKDSAEMLVVPWLE